MTDSAWITMIVSLTAVLTLVTFCLVRVLTLPPVEDEHLHGPANIDVPDHDDLD